MTVCPNAKKMEAKALPDDPCADPNFKEAAIDAARLRKDEVRQYTHSLYMLGCQLMMNVTRNCSAIVDKLIVEPEMPLNTHRLSRCTAAKCYALLLGSLKAKAVFKYSLGEVKSYFSWCAGRFVVVSKVPLKVHWQASL
eukprot:m.126163 g.126163  ORF g.126163 m.126163 type:complete len:139 (+) comp15767_c0_seq4:1066-1482(+)